ncbi:hypothetical protein RintRC_3469 [Richelia intracellularis]|nr:hypothetical protein RintRC_3469 [Richelia intracellularis]
MSREIVQHLPHDVPDSPANILPLVLHFFTGVKYLLLGFYLRLTPAPSRQ